MNGPDRMVLAIGGVVVAIIIAAVAVVLAVGEPAETDYAPDTPEGIVQRYLRAAYSGDVDTAQELLSERAVAEMKGDPFGRSFCTQSEGHLVRVSGVDATETRATVRLIVENVSGSGLDFERYRWDRSVVLVFENGGWRIDEPYFCA